MGNFGLKEMFLFLLSMGLSLVVAMMVYKSSFASLFEKHESNNVNTYDKIEEDLSKVAQRYTDNYYYKVLEDGDSDYVTVRQLQRDKLLTEIVDVKNTNIHCSGYVHFYKNGTQTYYDSYIRCGNNYQTNGYLSQYDENIK